MDLIETKFDADADSVYDAISLPNPDFIKLRDGGHLCDVSVRLRDVAKEIVDFPAHKLILVASSPFFHYLHDGGQLSDVVELPVHFRPATFSILLDAMYGKPITIDALYALPTGSFNEVVGLIRDLEDLASFLELRDVADRLKLWLEDSELHPDPIVKRELSQAALDEEELIKEENDDEFGDMPNAVPIDNGVELAQVTLFDFAPQKGAKKKTTKTKAAPRKRGSHVISAVAMVKPKDRQRVKDDDDDANDRGSSPSVSPREKSTEQRIRSSSISDDEEDDFDRNPPTSKSRSRRSSDGHSSGDSREVSLSKESETSHDPIDPVLRSQFPELSQEEIQEMFTNPRDRVMVEKMRVKNKIDPAIGSITSYHHAKDSPISMIGKPIPYGNRSARVDKIGNHLKTIAGEIRGRDAARELVLKLADGEPKPGVVCQFTGTSLLCPFCNQMVRVSSKNSSPFIIWRLATHFLSVHDFVWINYALICNICDFICFKVEHVKDHLVNFHGAKRDNPDDVTCAKCGKTFESKKSRNAHKRLCASGSKPKSPKEYQYPQRTHVCGSCGKEVSSALMLENHLAKEHGAPYRFVCNQEDCSFGTNVRSQLICHLFTVHKINTGALPILKCPDCDFVTLNKGGYQKHVLCHTALEYSFKCTHEGCDKAFKQKRHVINHVTSCHKNDNLPCPHCRNTFGSAKKLRKHVRVMHTHRFRNFKCSYCAHATVARENCITHMRRSHPGWPTTVIDLTKSGLTPLPI